MLRRLLSRRPVAALAGAASAATASTLAASAPHRDIYGEVWAPMRPEFLPLQVKHPSWDMFGGAHYLRPSFEAVPASRAAGPDLRELALRYFRWSRDEDSAGEAPTPLGNAEPWPWVWSQKPSIGSVVVVVGSGSAAAAALAEACMKRDPQLTTVIAIGDEQELLRHGVGRDGTEKTGVIDAAVHSIDWEAKILLTTPRDAGSRPVLSDWHPEERIIFFDELICT